MRGSLELSLNALVMFIVSIFVLGFGIFLVMLFLELGEEIIDSPDYCRSELNAAIAQGDRFVICPNTIRREGYRSNAVFKVEYAFINLADPDHELFGVNTTSTDFLIQPNFIGRLRPGEVGRGFFLIRAADGADVGPNERIRIYICPLQDPNDPRAGLECDPAPTYGDATDPRISRVLTINS